MTSAAHEWDQAAAAVRDAANHLRTASTTDLRAWAKTQGLFSRSLWPKVKRELYKQLDVDYDALCTAEGEQVAEKVAEAAAAASAPLVELYAAGDERGSFAVVGDGEDTAWYGTFHAKDAIFRQGDQDSADDSAAGKAAFLAGKLRDELAVPALRLILHISNPNVDGTRLAAIAAKHGVHLEQLEIADDNPASVWCEVPGHRAWQAIRLTDLLVDTGAGHQDAEA
ncbi:hypothetical protein HQ346_14355 [Rhodococcus sp. BP-252]|uniref:hypothetical protein n=1 Tax=unclassified Rhodococcus (in: high G+C Gram-positive bacteria) TaxID=192944 RepID=UPI001C9B90B3|nr:MULTISPECIES: hypothetical protein [unclassified Rhodococcus (in: high G+C Gram-positive bacteria)]MBY6412865.1 hypothetical protein [Rhodococcus sp. BP-320]MBY6417598.1 hypothetical protein [Rhodococcus sp. BP-321]MBY6423030.1 hypothetical protein [Rhodococcus sp. BP-324]MBY6427622.1 hypothetical protein [Rhodococcus sp. BP-323]MBY6432786.1 hypothetical protein [Rhodococcus sp. BP-322]